MTFIYFLGGNIITVRNMGKFYLKMTKEINSPNITHSGIIFPILYAPSALGFRAQQYEAG